MGPDLDLQSNLDISKLLGLFFYKFKLPEVQINLHFGLFGLVKKSQTPIMDRESNQNVCFIQIYTSSLAEFGISEFEISRFDCTLCVKII